MRGEREGRAKRWALGLAVLVLGCRVPAPAPAAAEEATPVEIAALSDPPAPAAVPVARPDPSTSLEARIDRHAVGADDFVRLDLYTWTTPVQIEALRAGGPLLVADALAGGRPTPYRLLLAAMARERRPGHALAALLQSTPALGRCRYAWPSPFATVLGLGSQRYGAALVRIRLRREAVIARLDPAADPPWTLRDGEGHAVEEDEVLAQPTRIGAVYHLRVDDEVGIEFREYVLCNAAMVEAWEVGTPAIAERVAAERHLVLDLSQGPFAALPRAHTRWRAWPQWLDAGEPRAWPSRWHRALAFDNVRYRPTPENLDALAQALLDYDPTPPALVWPPPPPAAEPAESNAAHTAR
jgi:hypothetical protein